MFSENNDNIKYFILKQLLLFDSFQNLKLSFFILNSLLLHNLTAMKTPQDV